MKKLILVALITFPILAQAQTFKYQKDISGFKHYKGSVTLTGTYSLTLDPEYLDYMGDAICFEPNKTSSALIPRPKGDERTAWFCFSNFEQAKKYFNYQILSKKTIASMKVRQQLPLTITTYLSKKQKDQT